MVSYLPISEPWTELFFSAIVLSLELKNPQHLPSIHATLRALDISEDSLAPSPVYITAYDNSRRPARGRLIADVQVGPLILSTTFHVIDILTAFNLLLGRPWLHEAGSSTYHQCLKFPFWTSQSISLWKVVPRGKRESCWWKRNHRVVRFNSWEAKLLRKDWPRPLLFAFPVCYLISNWLFVCDSFKEGSDPISVAEELDLCKPERWPGP